MRLLCPECKQARSVLQVSPGFNRLTAREFLAGAVRVRYLVDGSPADAYWLSPQFAAEHGVVGGEVELPEEYPEWTRQTLVACELCHFVCERPRKSA